ncbi:MAG: hypothetical protein M3P22_01850, partial [bacterium]|nr:hypothetical protein [bacterium]
MKYPTKNTNKKILTLLTIFILGVFVFPSISSAKFPQTRPPVSNTYTAATLNGYYSTFGDGGQP